MEVGVEEGTIDFFPLLDPSRRLQMTHADLLLPGVHPVPQRALLHERLMSCPPFSG